MIGTYILAASALAIAEPVTGAAVEVGSALRLEDSVVVTEMLSNQALALTMRGTTVNVLATALPAEGGCGARISARAPGSSRRWSRLFRWNEIAWMGTTADGATAVTFYDPEGRLPVDTLTFRPIDGPSFRTVLARLMESCRSPSGGDGGVVGVAVAGRRGCHFVRMPGLQLFDDSAPSRAVLSVLSRETSEAELQFLLESPPRDRGAGDKDAVTSSLAFTVADARLKDMRIVAAAFALDSQKFAMRHSIAAYGETRLRIRVEGLGSPVEATASRSFLQRIATAGEVTLFLLDVDKRVRGELHFDLGSSLRDAREAVESANWSCAGAKQAPKPAATWEPLS